MATEINGIVGPQVRADGTPFSLRGDKQGAQVVTDAHGKYTEAVYRGKVFMLDSDAVTLAAANTTKGAVGTIKLINGFFNPATSGVNASLLFAIAATTSGTPAGPLFYNYLVGVSTLAATGTIRSAILGSLGSQMTPQVNAVVTQAAGTPAFVQAGVMGGPAAIAAGAGVYSQVDELAGRIIVPPGVIFGLAAVGAGTTHIVQTTLVWEEIPV